MRDHGGISSRTDADANAGLQPSDDTEVITARQKGAEPRLVTLPDGRSLAVVTYGAPDGEPVLAFHGAPASRLMFLSADEPARRQGLRIIAFDRPGYGASPPDFGRGRPQPTLASRTEDHVHLVAALGLDRFSILAISGGAPYATALASRLGPRVRALALVSPMGPIADCLAEPPERRVEVALGHRIFFQRWPLRRKTMMTLGMRLGGRVFMAFPGVMAAAFARALGGADARLLAQSSPVRSLIVMTRDALAHGVGGGLADLDIYARPWSVDYSAITARTLLWQGTGDVVVPYGVAMRLAEWIPGCRLIRLDGAGHFWVLGRAKEVIAELRAEIDAESALLPVSRQASAGVRGM